MSRTDQNSVSLARSHFYSFLFFHCSIRIAFFGSVLSAWWASAVSYLVNAHRSHGHLLAEYLMGEPLWSYLHHTADATVMWPHHIVTAALLAAELVTCKSHCFGAFLMRLKNTNKDILYNRLSVVAAACRAATDSGRSVAAEPVSK